MIPRPTLLAGLLALSLSACTPTVQVRGNLPDPDLVSQIQPGTHSRQDIANLLGSPSTVSTFEDSRWYYIGQKSTQVAFFKPEMLEREVLVITFDQDGWVADTKSYDLADGRIIEPVDRMTPTEGREFTLLQQFLGNLGRYAGSDTPLPGRRTRTP